MIPLSALKELFVALPNSYITDPTHDNVETGNTEPNIISFIKDKKGVTIGSIDWQKGRIAIFEEYEYSEEVMQSIGADKFGDVGHHFDYDKDLPVKSKIPEDTNREIAELLYNQPTSDVK